MILSRRCLKRRFKQKKYVHSFGGTAELAGSSWAGTEESSRRHGMGATDKLQTLTVTNYSQLEGKQTDSNIRANQILDSINRTQDHRPTVKYLDNFGKIDWLHSTVA